MVERASIGRLGERRVASLPASPLAGSILTLSLVAIASPVAAAPPTSRLDRGAALEISRDARGDRDRGAPLRPRSDGGFDYRDPRQRFKATIHSDGAVTFKPAPPVEGMICPTGNCFRARGIGQYLLDSSQWTPKPSPNQIGSALHGGLDLSAPLPQNYAMSGRPGDGLPTPIMLGVGVRFGPPRFTDRMKAEFLRDTFELRLGLAARSERARLASALSVLEDKLLAVWNDRSRTIAERRELLFELWDECLDDLMPAPGDRQETHDDLISSLEELRHRAAGEARRRIILFIRARAPAGSAWAYTDDERRRFNARRISVEPFEPYDALVPAP